MNKFKNKWIFIIAILVIILGIVIFNNKDDISELIRINKRDIYNSTNNNVCKKVINKNILAIYDYNDTVSSVNDGYCVTGEESTCKEATCLSNIINNGWFIKDCKAGTIIKYQVNDNDIYYFNVLHDDGDTMTLQSVKDTTIKTKWGDSLAIGPITALTAITEATKDWINVNDLTYTAGETTFLKYPNRSINENPYTYCESGYCTTNSFILNSYLTTNVKARIISYQELEDLSSGMYPTFIKYDDSAGLWTLNNYANNGAVIIDVINKSFSYAYISSNFSSRAVVEIYK
jgi:hypothetical protein